MLQEIKKRIDRELRYFAKDLKVKYRLDRLSPLLFDSIREFILRPGKRIRPSLFIIGYLGFAKKPAPGLYRSSLSLELLHDFMLAHDDIIDKSDTRRGRPSLHVVFDRRLKKGKGINFSGTDLAIVAGDVLYALAIHAFLEIKERMLQKEQALRRFIEAAMYTGSGEFMELLYGLRGLAELKKEGIYKIYDYKTAFYSFASPLVIGATLAGAPPAEAEKLHIYGMRLGRAFQIKDDILGMFADEKEIGKSALTDLREAKKTLLVWYAFRYGSGREKKAIKRILGRENAGARELLLMRRILEKSGALAYAKRQIKQMEKEARRILASSAIREEIKTLLYNYS